MDEMNIANGLCRQKHGCITGGAIHASEVGESPDEKSSLILTTYTLMGKVYGRHRHAMSNECLLHE